MRISRSVTLAAGLALLVLPTVATTATAAEPGRVALSQAARHAAVIAYWTPARMRSAIPRDLVPSARGGHIVPRAKPGTGSGANTTGASWPNGQGAVYARTGKVYFVMGSSAYVCSGTAITDSRSGSSLVLTAGHCVYDESSGGGLSGFATNWLFIPQFDSSPTFTCANTAYGCWTADALVVNKGFASAGGFTTTATHYDWGFAVVGPGGKSGSAQLDATVGTFGISASKMATNTVVDAFGYPAAGKYHGNDLTYCQGRLGFDALTSNTNYKLACGMTGGSSGGPWFSGFSSNGNSGTIQSLNSYGYSGQSYMYGPIFNSSTTDTYNVANSSQTTTNTIVN